MSHITQDTRLDATVRSTVDKVLVGPTIAKYFIIWMVGVAVPLLPSPRMVFLRSKPFVVINMIALTAILLAGRFYCRFVLESTSFTIDLVSACAFGLLCYALFNYGDNISVDRKPALCIHKQLAGFSYSLYLLHYPFLNALKAFAISKGLPIISLRPTVSDSILLGFVCILALTYAWLVSLITEHQTSRIRRVLMHLLTATPKQAMANPQE